MFVRNLGTDQGIFHRSGRIVTQNKMDDYEFTDLYIFFLNLLLNQIWKYLEL